MEPTPEEMLAELDAYVPSNEILLREYLLKMFYCAKQVEEMRPIISPDRTYPVTRG